MEAEPNMVIPRPFPHEPSEVLERSTSLDVTPERALAKRKRSQRKKDRRMASSSWLVKLCLVPLRDGGES